MAILEIIEMNINKLKTMKMEKKRFKNAEVEAYIKGTLRQLKYLRSRWLNPSKVKRVKN